MNPFLLRRLTLFIGLPLALIVIGLIIFFTFFYNPNAPKQETPTETSKSSLPEATVNTNVTTSSVETAVDDLPAASEEEKQSAGVSVVAKNFVERFGTYSNQAGDQAIEDLSLLVTAKMLAWLKQDYQAKISSGYAQYRAMTAKVIDVRLLSQSAEKAVALVDVRRSEEGEGGERVYSQAVKLDLIKSGKNWKVDSAYWQ